MTYSKRSQRFMSDRSIFSDLQKTLLGSAVFLVFAFFGRHHYLCKEKNMCGNEGFAKNGIKTSLNNTANNNTLQTAFNAEKKQYKTLDLEVADSVILQNYEEFFAENNKINTKLNFNNELFLLHTAEYLRKHSSKILNITGFFPKKETVIPEMRNSIYDNLGIARAEAIREILIRRFRANPLQVQTDGQAMEDNLPLNFDIIQQTAENAKVLKEGHCFENMTFSVARNFAENSPNLQPSVSFLAYSDSLNRFLQKHSNRNLVITSHSDKDENLNMSLKRAETLAYFFKQLGIKNKTTIKNAAAENPIAPNSTEEGKNKNRRINIAIF